MLHRRAVIGLIASAGTLSGSQIVLAKEKHHQNGNALLGAKIKQNGNTRFIRPARPTCSRKSTMARSLASARPACK